MKDQDKTKAQLLIELEKIRQRLAVLEASEVERKQAEQFIRTQAEVTKNMAGGAYIVGLHDVIIRWASPKFEDMFGYEPGEMIGRHASIVNAPIDLTPIERADEIMEVIRRTGEWHGEVNNIKKDGTPFWCYASVSIFTHPEYGEVLLAVHTDITERKQAEEKLRKRNDFIETILDNLPIGLAVNTVDDGVARYLNKRLRRYTAGQRKIWLALRNSLITYILTRFTERN